MGWRVRLGLTSFMSIYVLVAPVVLSLLVALIFGDLSAHRPRAWIFFDAGGNETHVAVDLAILIGFIVILAFVLAREIQRQQQQLALEG